MFNPNLLTDEERNKKSLEKLEASTLTNDFLFNRVMKEADVLLPTLRRILWREQVAELVKVDSQLQIDESKDSKGFRLDVRARDETGRNFDVEMQVVDNHNLIQRSLAYYSGVVSIQLHEGDMYQKLRPIYVIFLTAFDALGLGRQIAIGRVQFQDVQGNELVTSPLLNFVFIDVTANDSDTPPDLQRLCEFINDGTVAKDDPLILKLDQRERLAKKNAEWRLKFMQIDFARQDQEWALEQSKAEGIAEGELKGEAKAAEAVIQSMDAEGQSKNEIISFLTKMMKLPQTLAEQYYDQALAVH